MSKDMDGMELLKKIAALDFMIIEFNLYLNTHPEDREALSRFNHTVEEARALKETYGRHYGMLTTQNFSTSSSWEWLHEPWPWQYEANYRL